MQHLKLGEVRPDLFFSPDVDNTLKSWKEKDIKKHTSLVRIQSTLFTEKQEENSQNQLIRLHVSQEIYYSKILQGK